MATRSAELNNGIRTSWLPVTAAWPTQSACSSLAWVRATDIQPSKGEMPYIFDPAYAQTVNNDVTCVPPQAVSWMESANTLTIPITSYSLGPLVCPEAYTTVSTSVVKPSSTSVVCCPSNMTPTSGLYGNSGVDGIVCFSSFTSGQSLVFDRAAISKGYTSATTTFTDSSILLLAPAIEGYNFDDSSSTSGSSSSATTSSTSTSATADSQSANTGAIASNKNGGGGLSSGAKAGIGVGVALGAVLLAALAAAIWAYRRKHRKGPYTPTPQREVQEIDDGTQYSSGGTYNSQESPPSAFTKVSGSTYGPPKAKEDIVGRSELSVPPSELDGS